MVEVASIPVTCDRCGAAPSPIKGVGGKWRVQCLQDACRASGPERVSIEDAITNWNAGERVAVCSICRDPDEGLRHRHPCE